MDAHQIPHYLHQSGRVEMLDPGNGNTINVDRNPCSVPLISAGAETRTLGRPTRAGVYLMIYVQTYVGAITVTVTGGYNVNGATVLTLGAAGQWATFFSAYDGTNYYWDMVANYQSTNITVGGPVVAITTLAVTAALHANRTILLSLLAGFTSTLPAATGTGNKYLFKVGIVRTSNSYIIVTAGSDVFKGALPITKSATVYDTAGAGETFISTAGTTITLNATTTGGLAIGDWIEVEDVATAVWHVRGFLTGSGRLATPFS